MLVENLQLDRYGRESNLALGPLTEGLNVVFRPEHEEAASLVPFLRWMFFGPSNDESATEGHAGSLTCWIDGRRRRLTRRADGTRYGLYALDGEQPLAPQSRPLFSFLDGMTARDFDTWIAPWWNGRRRISELLQSSLIRGIDTTSTRVSSERLQDLRLRMDQYRQDRDRLPWAHTNLVTLTDRRRDLERRIDAITSDHHRRRDEYDRQHGVLLQEIQALEADVDRQRAEWHACDTEVSHRRADLDDAYRTADHAKREYLTRRETELSEIESHLSRARGHAVRPAASLRPPRVATAVRRHQRRSLAARVGRDGLPGPVHRATTRRPPSVHAAPR